MTKQRAGETLICGLTSLILFIAGAHFSTSSLVASYAASRSSLSCARVGRGAARAAGARVLAVWRSEWDEDWGRGWRRAESESLLPDVRNRRC